MVASDFIVFGQVLDNPVLFEKYFREQWYLLPLLLIIMVLPFLAMRFERVRVVDRRWTLVSVAAGILLLWQIQVVLLKPHAPLNKFIQRCYFLDNTNGRIVALINTLLLIFILFN